MQISRFPVLADQMAPMFFIQLSIFSVVVVGFILFIVELIKKKNNII
jgi:hypothetical protein